VFRHVHCSTAQAHHHLDILADYPDLEPDDQRAAHAYDARLSRSKRFEPLPAA
jgi:uncharacterized protein (DUF433 family)